MVDEASLEGAAEDGFLVVDKDTDTLVLQFADDTGTEVYHLFIIIGNSFFFDTIEVTFCLFCRFPCSASNDKRDKRS